MAVREVRLMIREKAGLIIGGANSPIVENFLDWMEEKYGSAAWSQISEYRLIVEFKRIMGIEVMRCG